ncbi:MAG: hypothetical protein ACR2M7_02290 [Bdellovibrionales bacterium]
MYLFNKKLIVLFKLLILNVVLISCAGREKQKRLSLSYNSNAPFIVEQITKPENLLKAINFIEKEGLKNIFVVNLSTCLKDSFKKDNSIQETSFVIEYETNFISSEVTSTDKTNSTAKPKSTSLKKIQVTSDVNGCIQWQEEYKYRYVVNPKWLVLNRTIKKESGAYYGQVEIPMAINPWLENGQGNFPEILDLRTNYSKKYPVFKKHPYEREGLKYLAQDDSSEYPQLWAPTIDLQIENLLSKKSEKEMSTYDLLKKYQTICDSESEEGCYNRHLKLSLTVPLNLRTHGLQQDLVDEAVKGGSYNVSLQLLVVPDINKKHYRINKDICSKKVYISNERNSNQRSKYINLSCDIPISYFSKHANYKLALQIEPLKELPFTRFEGIYTINLTQEIQSGSIFTYVIDNEIDNYYKQIPIRRSIIKTKKIEYIHDAIQKNETVNKVDVLSDLGFNSVHLDVALGKVTLANIKNDEDCSTNETVVKRTARFIGKACIKDVVTEDTNQGIKFRVFVEDLITGDIVESFSDTKNKTIPQADANGCLTWTDSIEHKNYNRQKYFPRKIHFLSEEMNLYGTTKAALSPWQRAFQSYQDISQLSDNEIRTKVLGVSKPELVINQFKSVNLFPSYILDKFLNVHVFHNLYFLFQPIVTRPDNISLGREHKAREFLRDGYYVVRIMILRNPQETEDLPRVIQTKTLDKIRETRVPLESITNSVTDKDEDFVKSVVTNRLKGRYITHIDTVIRASANFVNMYVPLHFNKDQFFYIASRNMISVQVIPVDPEGFQFKEINASRSTCEIDFKKTQWKPFFDHDLITKPYVGAFQIPNWTNWNILQPLSGFNTDEIIDENEVGRKYKHFNLSSKESVDSKPVDSKIKPIVINGIENPCKDISSENFESCTDISSLVMNDPLLESHEKIEFQENRSKNYIKNYYKGAQEDISIHQLVGSFSEKNALRVVDLYTPKGNQFTKDLNTSYKNTYLLNEDSELDIDGILDVISNKEMKKEIKAKMKEHCPSNFFEGILAKIMVNTEYEQCLDRVVESYVLELINKQEEETKVSTFSEILNLESERSEIKRIIQYIMNDRELSYNVSSEIMKNVSRTLEYIIDEGIFEKNKEDPEIKTLGKSLCSFWLDSFYEDYLTPDQMRAAYTNYIKKYDYYRVLESNGISDAEKGDFIVGFMNMISEGQNRGESEIKKCHIAYGNCMYLDHCKERDHNKNKRYCERSSQLEEGTCMKVVESECSKDPTLSVCKENLDAQSCHNSLNFFCKYNLNHRICEQYSSRCLSNYYSCLDSDEINEEFSAVKNKLFQVTNITENIKSKKSDTWYGNLIANKKIPSGSLLESCLKNPFDFFDLDFKMFVGELSEKPSKYIEGFSELFSVAGSFSLGSYMNWTSQRGTSLGIKHGAGVSLNGAGMNFTAADVSLSKSISSNASNSGRRAIDVRVAHGAFLASSRATFDINVKKFKKCMVIRPTSNAFFNHLEKGVWRPYKNRIWSRDFNDNPYKKIITSRPGLMICNPEQNRPEDQPEVIRENYYYISQSTLDPNNSQFLNPYDLANRPFMIVLRGYKEYLTYFQSMKNIMEGDNGDLEKNSKYNYIPSNMFVNYPDPVQEVISLNLSKREFKETGFHHGVYTYAYLNNDFNYKSKKDSNMFEKAFKAYEGVSYGLPVPTPDKTPVPIQNY